MSGAHWGSCLWMEGKRVTAVASPSNPITGRAPNDSRRRNPPLRHKCAPSTTNKQIAASKIKIQDNSLRMGISPKLKTTRVAAIIRLKADCASLPCVTLGKGCNLCAIYNSTTSSSFGTLFSVVSVFLTASISSPIPNGSTRMVVLPPKRFATAGVS